MSKDKHVRENEAANAESETAGEPELDMGTGESYLENPEEAQDGHGFGDDAGGAGASPEAGHSSVEESADDENQGSPSEETSGDRVDELKAEIAELTDALLRKTADFDNYRKRMLREREEFASYANRELLLDIVAIIDDFERAIRSADESHDFTAFHDGIVMIEKQFISMLERKWKLVRFDSVGEEFDPQRHEAMMTEESPDLSEPVVVEDFQKGYLLHDKVLRPAKVKVSMPGGAPASDQG